MTESDRFINLVHLELCALENARCMEKGTLQGNTLSLGHHISEAYMIFGRTIAE